jgi:2-dehydro-3-deoxyphosphogluconate aldolase/(4S)-4-hydroxy-2-oxoglutarate aldolase
MMGLKTTALIDMIRAPVIPVVTIEDPAHAEPLARALVEAGLPTIEVTLRTDRALHAMEIISRTVPDAILIAGTVVAASQIAEAIDAGARAIVTPGTTPRLADALAAARVPVMPGCATASEAMALAERGFEILKFFPAGPSGGPTWLKSLSGPLPDLRFCPTGGVDAANAGAYLAVPNVIVVGGSWMAPASWIAAGDFEGIRRLAAEAARLRG